MARPAGMRRRVSSRLMVHLRHMSKDGWTGRSPIEVAAESMGLFAATGVVLIAAVVVYLIYRTRNKRE